jgi:hypothetical protein
MPGFDAFVPLTALFAYSDPLEPTLGGQLVVIVVVLFWGLFIFKCAMR